MNSVATSAEAPAKKSATGRHGRAALEHASVSFFWLGLVPAALATCAGFLIASSPGEPNASGAGASLEAWLQDQVLLVWLATFVLTTALLSYWKPLLPPRRFWRAERAGANRVDARTLLRGAALVVLAIASALAVRAFVGEPAKVRSSSMLPTLYPGDLLLVSKWRSPSAALGARSLPERGRPILFATPDPAIREIEPALFKRVIGLPGDVLTVEHGAPVINGWHVPRCGIGLVSLEIPNLDAPTGGGLVMEWLGDQTYLTLLEGVSATPSQGPYTVKAGEVWVLGDNRNNSSDSRSWFAGKGGGVPTESVHGFPAWTLLNTLGTMKLHVSRLAVPKLPSSAQQLSPAFTHCLEQKPARTTPPPPTSAKSKP